MNMIPYELMGLYEPHLLSSSCQEHAQGMMDEDLSTSLKRSESASSSTKTSGSGKMGTSEVGASENVVHIIQKDGSTGGIAAGSGNIAFLAKFAGELKGVAGTGDRLAELESTNYIVEHFLQRSSSGKFKKHLKKFLSLFLLKSPKLIRQRVFDGWFSGRKKMGKLMGKRNQLMEKLKNEYTKEQASSSDENTITQNVSNY
jgi:hypothetical protein